MLGDAQQRAKEWLKSVLEMHKSSKNSLEFIENVKIDLFPDEVYVFTPKGSIMELPAGATPVDFAYAIHSDVGNTCVAAKLDRRLAPLSTPLINGQQVEIITAPGARPNPAWLSFVVTGKARSKIKHFLKKQQRDESMELGKRLVEKSLHTFGLSLSNIATEHLESLVKTAKLESINHFYEEVGIGNRSALLAAKQLAKLDDASGKTLSIEPISPSALTIAGTEGVVVVFAKCCRPIPGDPIGGYIKPSQGLIVHAEHCPALIEYQHDPEKYVSLHWEKNVQGDFPIDLSVSIANQRGSLASLALTISENDSNISNINVEEFDGRYFAVNLTITTRNRIHLARILRKIRNNKNIVRVIRQKPKLKKEKRK